MATVMQVFLLHGLLHVLTLQTFAGCSTAASRTMALAVFLQAVAFLALTFSPVLAGSDQE